MSGRVSAVEDQFLMIHVFIYPPSPSSHCSLKGFNSIELWIDNTTFLKIILPAWPMASFAQSWLVQKWHQRETHPISRLPPKWKNWNNRLSYEKISYPLAVFPWVHQWPVLKTSMSACIHREADLSIWSIRSVGLVFPSRLRRVPSFTRKCDRRNSTVQL